MNDRWYVLVLTNVGKYACVSDNQKEYISSPSSLIMELQFNKKKFQKLPPNFHDGPNTCAYSASSVVKM